MTDYIDESDVHGDAPHSNALFDLSSAFEQHHPMVNKDSGSAPVKDAKLPSLTIDEKSTAAVPIPGEAPKQVLDKLDYIVPVFPPDRLETLKAKETAKDIARALKSGDVEAIQKQLAALKGNFTLALKTVDALKDELPADVKVNFGYKGGKNGFVQIDLVKAVPTNVIGVQIEEVVSITNDTAQATEVEKMAGVPDLRRPLKPGDVLKKWADQKAIDENYQHRRESKK